MVLLLLCRGRRLDRPRAEKSRARVPRCGSVDHREGGLGHGRIHGRIHGAVGRGAREAAARRALRHGGTNAGGPGRPPSELRRTLRASFAERIRILEEIADKEEAADRDRIRAVDTLAKYALSPHETWNREQVLELMTRMARVVENHVQSTQTMEEIRRDWIAILVAEAS